MSDRDRIHLPSVLVCQRRSVAVLCAALLAGASAMVGFACGIALKQPHRPLPKAGSFNDLETGFLARASRSIWFGGWFGGGFGGASYGSPAGAGEAAADPEAPAEPDERSPGGTRYGNYRFDWASLHLRRAGSAAAGRHAVGYRGGEVHRWGTIAGRVVWTRPPAFAEPAASDCPGGPKKPSLPVAARGGRRQVAGAVVYLEDIETGRKGLVDQHTGQPRLQAGGVLRQSGCYFTPRVQIVSPIGAALTMFNGDSAAHSWTGTMFDPGEDKPDRPLFHFRLASGSSRRLRLTRAGLVEVRDEESQATAWVVVARHPYYAMSDRDGRFRLDEVPPGTYDLVVWHPPVARRTAGGKPELTRPFVGKRKVEVKDRKIRELTIRLPAAR